MKTIELHDFIPFPGNYFSYVFTHPQEIENKETVLLKLPTKQNLAIEAKVVQQVLLDNENKVQFHAIRTVRIEENDRIERVQITCDQKPLSENEKNDFKELLIKWDAKEYAITPNHYFELIDQADNKMRLLELVGGCVNRPYKFPFTSKVGLQNALEVRANILSLDTCEKQLNELRKLLVSEAI